ncbi:MAG: hypothetical protein K2O02_00610 [Lachnospiraceae bacterium]|nr:hypothetical protein [Lachnospiraceae bacterium]
MFTEMQHYKYPVKIRRAEQRAEEFFREMQRQGYSAHVSVGGLDSITLYLFLRSIGIHVPAISVSAVEDLSIQRVHKALNITRLISYKSKMEVINEIGFPVISKRIAGKIDLLQHPTEENKTVRHAIITGECGEQGHFAKNSRMKLPQKWLNLFAGMANEEYGTHYQQADFKVSNKCCYYLKEKPCDDWAKEHKSFPYLGMMASEGGQREEALIEHGCNYYGKTVMRSAPFAIFLRQDILTLALEMDQWYKDHIWIFEDEWNKLHKNDRDFKPYEPLDTIIPAIYGTIEQHPNGEYYTTKAQRTGCSMCGFGIHLEQRPHRFDRLRQENPKEWEFWMYRCCKNPETGEVYGWGKVLDYIGVGWEDIPATQINLFDYYKNLDI